MPHIIEPASSGRARCRGCGKAISKGELRFGERLPNPFADDGDMTLWFHLLCASLKRPESLAEIVDSVPDLPDSDALKRNIEFGLNHHRSQRVNGIERAPSGRARCRSCQEMIVKGQWRIPLVFFEEGMFNSAGNVHLSCSSDYFETTNIVDRMLLFGGEIAPEDVTEIKNVLTD